MEVGDLMSVKEKMTAIADAIRGKTGETGLLTLDMMADAIVNMSVGSTDNESLKTTSGEFSPTTSGVAETIDHGLGEIPKTILFFAKNGYSYMTGQTTNTFTSFYALAFSLVMTGKTTSDGEDGHAIFAVSHYVKPYQHYKTKSTSATTYYTALHTFQYIDFLSNPTADEYKDTCASSITETSFVTPKRVRNGVTYKWIAMNKHLLI